MSSPRRCAGGKPLGLNRDPDRFGWAVICWTGPAAEAVAATRSGTRKRDAAQWIWALYQAEYSGAAASGDSPGTAATDPAVVVVALSVHTVTVWPARLQALARVYVDARRLVGMSC